MYNGTAWEVVTSSGFVWQSYENPTWYYDIYDVGRLGKNPAQFVKEGLVGAESLNWSILSYEWSKGDIAVMKVDSIWNDNVTHALPYPLEQALKDSQYIKSLESRISQLEKVVK
jgi:hypothetical protein